MNGNIEIKLPKEEQISISLSKVGFMVNGEFVLEQTYSKSGVDLNEIQTANQMEQAAKRLIKYSASEHLIETSAEGIAKYEDVEEGVYLINGENILPTLLFMPTWDEVEQKMLYNVTIIPKYGEKEIVPNTGDFSNGSLWLGVLVLSVAVLAYQVKKFVKKRIVF